MRWIDCAGPPGVGKSTLCGPLWGNREVSWNQQRLPIAWKPFCEEIDRVLGLLADHWSYVPAVRMTMRSIYKMATVYKLPESGRSPYIQTGFIQRGLGYGWRLNELGMDLDELRPFFRLMPVSLGAVFLEASPETIEARNKAREKVPETAHENRGFMVRLMLPAIEVAIDELTKRGVPLVRIDTERPLEEARQELVGFAGERAGHAAQV